MIGLILEMLITLVKIIYFEVERFVLFFVPKKGKNVDSKIVLVTGSGSGIGRLTAIKLAAKGAILVLCDINKEAVDDLAKEINETKGTAHSYRCDLTKRENVYEFADRVAKEVGPVDILVNNAGLVQHGNILQDLKDDMIVRIFEVNTLSHFWTIKAFLPKMIENRWGHIVNVASMAGYMSTPYATDYNASKFADIGLFEGFVEELHMHGHSDYINTTLVCPFFISTGMFAGVKVKCLPGLLDWLTPDNVAERIVHGILFNEPHVIVPKWMGILPCVKNALGLNSIRAIGTLLGVRKCMTTLGDR